MAEHESAIGESDEWFTPRSIFDALDIRFDLDPCSPGPGHWVPADWIFTRVHDGLSRPWFGRVFCNPPYGARHGQVPWLLRFLDHGDGIAIFRAYTSADWFHDHLPRAEMILFPRGKTQFVPDDRTREQLEAGARANGKVWRNAPGHGVVLVAMGAACCDALAASGLGMTWDRR